MVPKLCAALAVRGNTVRLHVLEPSGGTAPPGVEFVTHPRSKLLRPLGISKSLKHTLELEAADGAGVLHAHSLWTMASIYPGRVAAHAKCPYIHSPHGTLAAWALAHHKWRKRLLWPLQRRSLARANCLHVTSEKERDDVRSLGFSNPAAIIHNGIDLPPLGQSNKHGAMRRLLFLGRVHPVKALDRLLESWKSLQSKFSGWELTIAGEDDGGYLAKLQAMSLDMKLARVAFPGLVRESERDALYQSADLFVLPSHTENFGIAAAEALANGVPAVISKFAPWKNLEHEGCGWWSDTQPGVLAECLSTAMSNSREYLAAMGARGRAWMARDFSWQRAAEMMEQTYIWLLGGGNAPAWVQS